MTGARSEVEGYMAQNRLLEKYRNDVVPALMEEFGYKSVMQVPRVTKAVINIGVGEALDNAKALDEARKEAFEYFTELTHE